MLDPNGFRLGQPIGRGARSIVFRATQLANGCTVAVKVGRADRIDREARALSRVSHPGVVRAIARGRDALVMELLAGETLTERLRRRGPFSERETIDLARELAEALAALHERNVVHRDLKPANIILTESGLKLIDLDIAQLDRSEDFQPGTRFFASPEQQAGGEVDARSDLYSLGRVMRAMLTGRAWGTLPPVHDELASLICALAAHLPQDRPQSAQDVVSLLSLL
jgi:serine/threonine-protein kinase